MRTVSPVLAVSARSPVRLPARPLKTTQSARSSLAAPRSKSWWPFWDDVNVKVMGYLRCAREVAPYMKAQGWGRIINISGTNARNAGNLSGGARNTSLVHLSKTLAVQLGRFGITVNCVHPGITRTERTPRLLAARGKELGIDAADVEKADFAHDSPRGNAIGRMVDAAEIAYVTAFLASDKAWAISGELIVATGGAGRSVYY